MVVGELKVSKTDSGLLGVGVSSSQVVSASHCFLDFKFSDVTVAMCRIEMASCVFGFISMSAPSKPLGSRAVETTVRRTRSLLKHADSMSE
jgi:hypothetical protein